MGVHWIPATAASAGAVRHSLDADLHGAGLAADIAADAAVLASELVANAVRHARPLPSGQLQVSWQVTDREVTVAVTDGGSDQTPQIRRVSAQDTSGRGLAIVAALADEWGAETAADGTSTVWARIDVARRAAAPR